jgi:hypothetical protein
MVRYDADTIKELFSGFQESIERFLLFLRKVDRIEVRVRPTPAEQSGFSLGS